MKPGRRSGCIRFSLQRRGELLSRVQVHGNPGSLPPGGAFSRLGADLGRSSETAQHPAELLLLHLPLLIQRLLVRGNRRLVWHFVVRDERKLGMAIVVHLRLVDEFRCEGLRQHWQRPLYVLTFAKLEGTAIVKRTTVRSAC